MALYYRQLGTAQLLTDESGAAIRHLDIAVNLNPSDDLAWRVLALANVASGYSASAWPALDRAIETQRSDPTNLLLRAKWQIRDGNHEEALETLGEVVQAWPEIVAAHGWSELLPPAVSTLDVIEEAMDRWSRDLASTVPRSPHPLLALMAGRSDLVEESAQELLGPSLGAAYLAVMSCDPNASVLLEQAPDRDRRTALYWQLVARQSRLDGQVDGRAERLFEIMTNVSWFSDPMDEALNPLNENGTDGYSADSWGYRRASITRPDYEELPSAQAGAARWLVEPREAVRSADLDTMLPRCG